MLANSQSRGQLGWGTASWSRQAKNAHVFLCEGIGQMNGMLHMLKGWKGDKIEKKISLVDGSPFPFELKSNNLDRIDSASRKEGARPLFHHR